MVVGNDKQLGELKIAKNTWVISYIYIHTVLYIHIQYIVIV